VNLKSIYNIYFVGIGGIGMSAIARYFSVNGKNVGGYDKTTSSIISDLQKINIDIHFEDAIGNIPMCFLNKDSTLVVYTPAIPVSNKELSYFIDNNFQVLKRAEILGKITENTFCLGVAGTHGKTTTSSILGHIMEPLKATAFLGGITENYNSNLILGDDKISVVEADEFDRSFLSLSPNIACITSVDADHLDVYGDHGGLLKSFSDFSNKVSDTLIVAKGLPMKGLTYAVDEKADFKGYNLRIENGTYIFDVDTPLESVTDIVFNLPGRHNIMNALAALAMANTYGVSLKQIKKQLGTFKGVKRRFSYKIKTNSFVLIDDYAHHPTEIKAVEESIREMYSGKEVLVIFQPHLFSRTADFADDFGKELSKFDEVVLLDIYPARELPIEGITSSWLLEKIDSKKKHLGTKDSLKEIILNSSAKIVVMLGAGDIGLLVDDVKNILEKEYQ